MSTFPGIYEGRNGHTKLIIFTIFGRIPKIASVEENNFWPKTNTWPRPLFIAEEFEKNLTCIWRLSPTTTQKILSSFFFSGKTTQEHDESE